MDQYHQQSILLSQGKSFALIQQFVASGLLKEVLKLLLQGVRLFLIGVLSIILFRALRASGRVHPILPIVLTIALSQTDIKRMLAYSSVAQAGFILTGVIGQDASKGNPFPQAAVQEFRVITQNYKAEYQKAASAVISADSGSALKSMSWRLIPAISDTRQPVAYNNSSIARSRLPSSVSVSGVSMK